MAAGEATTPDYVYRNGTVMPGMPRAGISRHFRRWAFDENSNSADTGRIMLHGV